MNIDRLTQKSLAAVQGAQNLAQEYGNQQLEQAHLLAALCDDAEGLIPQLLTAMGVDAESFADAVNSELGKLPDQFPFRRGGQEGYVRFYRSDPWLPWPVPGTPSWTPPRGAERSCCVPSTSRRTA